MINILCADQILLPEQEDRGFVHMPPRLQNIEVKKEKLTKKERAAAKITEKKEKKRIKDILRRLRRGAHENTDQCAETTKKAEGSEETDESAETLIASFLRSAETFKEALDSQQCEPE